MSMKNTDNEKLQVVRKSADYTLTYPPIYKNMNEFQFSSKHY